MAVTPLAFFQSPLHPPVGEFPTTRPKRGKGHASPWRVCHVPCCGTQMARRSSGLACRLQSGHRSRRRGRHGPCIFGRRLAGPPSRHFICTFHCFRFRLPMAAGDGPCPSALLLRSPCPRVNEDVTGVAVAGVAPKRRSLPALCTATTPYSPALARQLTPLHLTTLLLDGPLRRPLRRYTAHAGGSATPVATAP